MNPSAVQQFADTVLEFVELASFTTKKACDELVVHRGMQKKAVELAPGILDTLVKTGAVREEQREAANAMLGSHAETMNLLKSAVEELYRVRTEKQGTDLGEGIDDPEAVNKQAYDSINDPVVGRQTSMKKASDLAMLKVLDDPRTV
jgi:hypothetical protein